MICVQIQEECGYDVPLERIRQVTSYLSAIGISGSRQTIFAAEIDEGMAMQASMITARAEAPWLARHRLPAPSQRGCVVCETCH